MRLLKSAKLNLHVSLYNGREVRHAMQELASLLEKYSWEDVYCPFDEYFYQY